MGCGGVDGGAGAAMRSAASATAAALLAVAVLMPAPSSSEVVYNYEVIDVRPVMCHACGPRDLCPLPWDAESKYVLTFNCTSGSCMKFDGWASDDTRVVMRDCGFFYADEIVSDEIIFEWSTPGYLAHCRQDYCNGAGGIAAPKAAALVAVAVAARKLMW